MKKLIFLVALFCLTYTVNAQTNEEQRLMSLGQNNAISVILIHTAKDYVEKEWTKYIKSFGSKTKKNAAREIFTDDANIAAMSRNTIDIFATVSERGEDTELVVWFDLGGAFLHSEMHPDRYPVAEKMLKEFSLKVSRAAVESELALQESDLQKLADKLLRLRQEKQGLEKDIMEYAEKIAEARKKIESLTEEYNVTKEKRTAQEASVEAVKARLKEFNGVAKK